MRKLNKKKNQTKGPRGRPKTKLKPIEIENEIHIDNQNIEQLEETMIVKLLDQSFVENVDAHEIGIKEIDYEVLVWAHIKPESFLLVDFIGRSRKETHFKYVCLVNSVDDDEVLVQGMKKEDDHGVEFSFKENYISSITLNMIIAILILPTPEKKTQVEKLCTFFQGL